MSSRRSFVLAVIPVIVSVGPLRAWGCAGHHIVALIAKQHLSARALEATSELLETQPIDPRLARYCKDEAADPFVSASTWADDVKRAGGTGTWHYIDIPRSLTHGDLSPFCEPVGPLRDGSRTGCVLSAIRDQLGVLKNGSPIDRARALRYIIHLVADLHQPLHVTDNNDRGGNCVPLHFGTNSETTNLHALWDSGILESFLVEHRLTRDACLPAVGQPLSWQLSRMGYQESRTRTNGYGRSMKSVSGSPTGNSGREFPSKLLPLPSTARPSLPRFGRSTS